MICHTRNRDGKTGSEGRGAKSKNKINKEVKEKIHYEKNAP